MKIQMNRIVEEIKENPIIIDNLLGEGDEIFLNKVFLEYFHWKVSPATSPISELDRFDIYDVENNIKESPQMVANVVRHQLEEGLIEDPHNYKFVNYSYLPLYMALISKGIVIEKDWIARIKVNCQFKQNSEFEGKWNVPHVDSFDDNLNHITALYYPMDSDGDTTLFTNNYRDLYEGKIGKLDPYLNISPKRGRIVLFWGKTIHAGIHPTKNDFRVCINYNILLPDNYNIDKLFKGGWK